MKLKCLGKGKQSVFAIYAKKYEQWLLFIVVANVFVYSSGSVCGGIVGVTGDISLIVPPTSVELEALTSNSTIYGFSEKQNYLLVSDLSVDGVGVGIHGGSEALVPGVIATGVRVNSHFFHMDPVLGSGLQQFMGTVTFSTKILGIIFTNTELAHSDNTVGSTETIYQDHVFRDFELGDDCGEGVIDCATISPDLKSITLELGATVFWDQIRVITAVVPEPSSTVLAGVLAFGLLLKRKTWVR